MFLTWVHPAYLLDEGVVKPCDYGAPYWNHEILIQALNEGVNPSNTSSLGESGGKKTKQIKSVIPLFVTRQQVTDGNRFLK